MQFSFTAALVAFAASSALAAEYAPAPKQEVSSSSTPSVIASVNSHTYKYRHGPHTPVQPPSYTVPTSSSSAAVPVDSNSLKTPSAFKTTTPSAAPTYSVPKASTPVVPNKNTSTSEGHTTRTKYRTVTSVVHACPPGVKNCPYSKTTSLISTGVEVVPTTTPSASVPIYSAPPGSSAPYHYSNSSSVPHYTNTTSEATQTTHVTTFSETTVVITMTRPVSSSPSSEVPNNTASTDTDTKSYKSTLTSTHRVTVYPAATPVTGPNAFHPKSDELKVPESFGPGPTSPTGYDSTSTPGATIPAQSGGAGEKVPPSFGPGPASPTGYENTAVPGASGSAPGPSDTCEAPRTVTVTESAPFTITETAPARTVTETLAPQTVTITATSTATVNTEGPIQSSKKPHYPTKGPDSSAPIGTGTAPIGTGAPPTPVPSSTSSTFTSTSTSTSTHTITQTVTRTTSIQTSTPPVQTPATPVPTPLTPIPTPVPAPSGTEVPGQSSSSKLSAYIPLPVETPAPVATPVPEVPATDNKTSEPVEPPSYVYEPAMPTM